MDRDDLEMLKLLHDASRCMRDINSFRPWVGNQLCPWEIPDNMIIKNDIGQIVEDNIGRMSIDLRENFPRFELWLLDKDDKNFVKIQELETLKHFMFVCPKFFEWYKEYGEVFKAEGLEYYLFFPNVHGFFSSIVPWYNSLVAKINGIHQRIAAAQEQHQIDSPYNLIGKANTERANKYIGRAIDEGYIEKTATGLKWVGASKARLAYFLDKVYKDSVTGMPAKELEKVFNVSGLHNSAYQVNEAKSPQKWRKTIDEIFKDR